jgi:hypothetical protein
VTKLELFVVAEFGLQFVTADDLFFIQQFNKQPKPILLLSNRTKKKKQGFIIHSGEQII